MFILRLISQPKVERNLLDKYYVSNLGFIYLLNYMITKYDMLIRNFDACFRYLLNNMITKLQGDDGIVDYVLDTIYQLKSLKCGVFWTNS